jgi:hypothetical protein
VFYGGRCSQIQPAEHLLHFDSTREVLLGGFKSKNKRCANSVEVSSSLTTHFLILWRYSYEVVKIGILGDIYAIWYCGVH